MAFSGPESVRGRESTTLPLAFAASNPATFWQFPGLSGLLHCGYGGQNQTSAAAQQTEKGLSH